MLTLIFLALKERPVKTSCSARSLISIKERNCLSTLTSATNLAKHVIQGKGSLCTREGNLKVLRLSKSKRNILAEVLSQKSWLEVSLKRLRSKLFKCARRTHATSNNFKHLLNVKSTLLCQGHCVCIANHAGSKRNLVTKFCGLTLTGTTHAENLCREGLEKSAYWLNIILSCADNQRKSAVLSTLLAARNRTVKGMLSLNFSSIVNITSKLR